MATDRALSTVELMGALTYGQLRAFETTARAVRHAPDSRAMVKVTGFAATEHHSLDLLLTHLRTLTDLPEAVMDRQQSLFDEYFDAAPIDDWMGACTFFATGLPMARDFVGEVAPALDERTAEVVTLALGGRESFEQYAMQSLIGLVGDDESQRARVRHLMADLLGRALSAFQASLTLTDALSVLLEGEDTPSHEPTKDVALRVLAAHRRRMAALGLDDPS